MAIDKSSWHYEVPNFPEDMEEEQGGVHIAFFLRWLLENGFAGKEIIRDYPEIKQDVKTEKINVFHFLKNVLAGDLLEEDLTTEGLHFSNVYYLERETFSKNYGDYLADYEKLMPSLSKIVAHQKMYQSVKYTEENYQALKVIIDQRYQNYLKWKKTQETQ